jgi:hypothetical protein
MTSSIWEPILAKYFLTILEGENQVTLNIYID